MIGKLSGIIDSFGEDRLILDVQDVGYVVFASRRTLSRIGQTGDPACLLIETVVREDAINLYGFIDAAEKNWFKILTGVQGVGSKVALAILGICPVEQLAVIIASQDKAMLTRADGVGPKLATRILTELKDVTGKIGMGLEKPVMSGMSSGAAANQEPDINNDAVSALVNLGYGRAESFTAVAHARQKAGDNDKDNIQTLIRLALKELAA
jgi:Holliday junction DNA helicase RuvA